MNPLINSFFYFIFWLNNESEENRMCWKCHLGAPGEGRALGAGETARLIMLFSNDRIICYGSFDSSLSSFFSPFPPSLHLHLPEMKACAVYRVNNTASSNVASGNSEISACKAAKGEGGGRGPEVWNDRSSQSVKVTLHWVYAIQTPVTQSWRAPPYTHTHTHFLWLEAKAVVLAQEALSHAFIGSL